MKCDWLLRSVVLLSLWLSAAASAQSVAEALPPVTSASELTQFAEQHPVIRYSAAPAFAPLDFVAQGRHQGLAKDYLDRMAGDLKVRFELVPAASWADALGAFNRGEVDLLSSAFVSPESAQPVLFSQPWLRLSGAILMLSDQAPLTTLEALEQVPVAVVADSVWQERVSGGSVRLQLQTFADTRSALQALRDGTVRALVSDPLSALYEARRMGMERQLVATGQVPIEVQLAFAIRADWPQLQTLLNTALESISAEEEQRLRERWLPSLAPATSELSTAPDLPDSNSEEVIAALAALPEGPSAQREALEQARDLNQQADTLAASLEKYQAELAAAALPEQASAENELQQFLLWRTRLPERASAAELERRVAGERAALEGVEQNLAHASLQLDDVRRRSAELPSAREQSRLGMMALAAQDTVAVTGNAQALLDSAQRRLLLTRQAELQAESQLLPARENRLEQQTRRLRSQVSMARQRVAALVTLQRDRAVRDAELRLADMQARADRATGSARASATAQTNLRLAERLVEIAQRFSAAIPEAERQAQIRERVAQSLKLTRERLSIDTHSAGLGQLLIAEQRLLESPRQPRRQLAEVLREQGALRLEQIELDNQRDSLSAGLVERSDTEEEDQTTAMESRLTLLDHQDAQRKLLDELQALTQRLQSSLETTAAVLAARIKDSSALQELITNRLLWLPTQPPVSLGWLRQLPTGFIDLASPSRWKYTSALLMQSMVDFPVRWVALAVAILGLWLFRRGVPARLRVLASRTRQVPTRGMRLTIRALLMSLLAAAFWPGLLAILGEVLQRIAQPGKFSDSLGLSLQALALQIYSLTALYWLTRPEGLTAAHFQWPASRSEALHRFSKKLLLLIPPLLFMGILEHNRGTELGSSTVGRISLIVLVLALARLSWKALAPGADLSLYPRDTTEPVALWRRFAHFGLAASLVLLAVLLLAGYGPIAYVLLRALVQTLMLIFLTLIVQQLALRWLLLQERRLAELRYVQEREARQQEVHGGESSDAPPALEPELVTLRNIASQTRRLLRATLLTCFALGLLWVWAELLPALQVLDGVKLWMFTEGEGTTLTEHAVTLRSLVLSLLSFMLTFIAARNLPGLLEVGLLERFPVDAATRYAITSVSRYVIVIAGLVIGVGLLGLRWGHLQWLAAALTVGLGFGLQEIFANFVSGLILLFERPFRIGDTITIGPLSGTVTRIRTRATTILDWDNKEIVVPNKTFITGDLTNWTLSDEITRVTIAVGVAYDSDPDHVHRILRELAHAHPLVLKDPKPSSWLLRFAASSLDFELRVYVAHIRDRLPVTSELNAAVRRRFDVEGIEIPFPQVEMRQRDSTAPLDGNAAEVR